ncbi:NADP-specific glutamate dehydrogenase [Maricaulaceae bacterium EIL42A08]|nr:NADP-specific glutamate dehydrogenase [Maricaulaceae bacterium EIL42A08]
MNSSEIEAYLEAHAPGETEFHQAVLEAAPDIERVIKDLDPDGEHGLGARLLVPERLITFRVAWRNDDGEVEVNRGYRVQFNGAVGPYKGGLRFAPSVNVSVLKFLAFEQAMKNALTGLPLGAAKGGADFDPKGRSEREIERFCIAFMTELHRHIGPDLDVPAGDQGVGAQEIGWLFGAYRRITGQHVGVLTGKGTDFGGSPLRPEATGYGLVYFVEEFLKHRDDALDGKSVLISGAGNVATFAAHKAIEKGAKVLTLSNSTGCLVCMNGLTANALDALTVDHGDADNPLKALADNIGAEFQDDATPWDVKADIALPCATQNELDEDDAKTLIKNGICLVAEGANMPCTAKAQATLIDAGIPLAPGKAANAGGVAVSGLEMIQNASREPRTAEDIDTKLKAIMGRIHQTCVDQGGDGADQYIRGANTAGLRKVLSAMKAQGV